MASTLNPATRTFRLPTPWSNDVSQSHPHPEYPRPQFARENWSNLNGQWDFSIDRQDVPSNASFDKKILVPFPVESELSNVAERVEPEDRLWYRTTFAKPDGERVLLHFGAVNFSSTIWLNGKEIGSHKGGFDRFSFDITESLSSDSNQELVLRIDNPVNRGDQPRGKQTLDPEGIYYTAASGIWQTVWVEAVHAGALEGVDILADVETAKILVRPRFYDDTLGQSVTVRAVLSGETIAEARQNASTTEVVMIELDPQRLRLWSPEDPILYDLIIEVVDAKNQLIDSVRSYTAFRTVSLGKDTAGVTRILFNGKPTFMFGPLDQGFWPDGIFTPPSEAAMIFDIEQTKELGFNMIRKHVKVECDRWYYWCDRLGIFVWQDMPSGDKSIKPEEPDIVRTPESAAQFEKELALMIYHLRNHPSIVCWVPFNEGWGQYDTARITELTRALDETRLIDSTTGWSDRGVGDMIDWHIYPGPESPEPEENRVAVLGEFGGLGLPVPDHLWQPENWGYKSYKTKEELDEATFELFDKLKELVHKPGLSAAVYTQTTDVETETNGFFTYDRKVLKMNKQGLRAKVLACIEAL